MAKVGLGVDVLTAARQRTARLFDDFERVCVSFSGGKDSTVALFLAVDEARRRGRKIAVLFIDWEAQYSLTIEHVRTCLDVCADVADPYWIALPLTTVNAVSQIEPEWICWDPDKRDLWVRDLPPEAITDGSDLPFYKHAMTFEEFAPEFARWFAGEHTMSANILGLRSDESLNRYRTIASESKSMHEGLGWTTWQGAGAYNAYPIYDWHVDDVWTYHSRYPELPYNRLYDRMHQAGLTPHQMRICEPFGDEARRGLWMFHAIEPDTWAKLSARVAGANSGALYVQESGNVLGNRSISLPAGHTWESFAHHILDTMPAKTAEHYRDKIAVYIRYCSQQWPTIYGDGLPDAADGDTGSRDEPSWRRVCKVLLRNDYWCQGLSFSPQKASYYEKYRKIMRRRRQEWGII